MRVFKCTAFSVQSSACREPLGLESFDPEPFGPELKAEGLRPKGSGPKGLSFDLEALDRQVERGGAGAMKGRGSFLNAEPLNTEHSKCLSFDLEALDRLIAIPNRNCLTHVVKQSACKELM